MCLDIEKIIIKYFFLLLNFIIFVANPLGFRYYEEFNEYNWYSFRLYPLMYSLI